MERIPKWMRNKETMLILFLSGILLFVIFLPVDSKNVTNRQLENELQNSQADNIASGVCMNEEMTLDEYRNMLETELEEFLSGVSGIGEVKALIYMKASWEYRVEKDKESNDTMQGEDTVYTVNEYGHEVPFVAGCSNPKIDGVAVRAEGAENEEVRVRLVRLIMALYGLEANKVEVIY